MRLTHYFNRLLAVVAEVSELTTEDILHGRKTDDVVDSRWIIVKVLAEQGYSTAKIAMLLDMSQRNVAYILASWHDRISQNAVFRSTYIQVRAMAGNISAI